MTGSKLNTGRCILNTTHCTCACTCTCRIHTTHWTLHTIHLHYKLNCYHFPQQTSTNCLSVTQHLHCKLNHNAFNRNNSKQITVVSAVRVLIVFFLNSSMSVSSLVFLWNILPVYINKTRRGRPRWVAHLGCRGCLTGWAHNGTRVGPVDKRPSTD